MVHLEGKLRAVSLFLENCGEKAKQVWKRALATSGSRHRRTIVARTSRLQSRSHTYLFCVLPHGFSRKRKTTRSLPGGVRDEQKGLGFTGREGEKSHSCDSYL